MGRPGPQNHNLFEVLSREVTKYKGNMIIDVPNETILKPR
jgi:hypothetical protein